MIRTIEILIYNTSAILILVFYMAILNGLWKSDPSDVLFHKPKNPQMIQDCYNFLI